MTTHRSGIRALRFGLAHLALLTAALVAAVVPSRPAQAMSRDVRTVLVVGTYGLVGGTVLGLVALPATQDVRTVFIGGSLGLYLGIVIGVYYVLDRENLSNSLKRHGRHELDSGGTGAEDAERAAHGLRLMASARQASELELFARSERAPMRFEIPVLTF